MKPTLWVPLCRKTASTWVFISARWHVWIAHKFMMCACHLAIFIYLKHTLQGTTKQYLRFPFIFDLKQPRLQHPVFLVLFELRYSFICNRDLRIGGYPKNIVTWHEQHFICMMALFYYQDQNFLSIRSTVSAKNAWNNDLPVRRPKRRQRKTVCIFRLWIPTEAWVIEDN